MLPYGEVIKACLSALLLPKALFGTCSQQDTKKMIGFYPNEVDWFRKILPFIPLSDAYILRFFVRLPYKFPRRELSMY